MALVSSQAAPTMPSSNAAMYYGLAKSAPTEKPNETPAKSTTTTPAAGTPSGSEPFESPDIKHLADIEHQILSHGRHPAEWDAFSQEWIGDNAPAAPYFMITEAAMKPRRPREVISELLAAGFPMLPTAHVTINNVIDRKAFVKKTKRVLAVARDTVELTVHAYAIRSLGLLKEEHVAFLEEILDLQKSGTAAPIAVQTVREANPSVAGSMTVSHVEAWATEMKTAAYEEACRVARQRGRFLKQATVAGAKVPLASVAEKCAQYLSSFYHQEIREVRNRRANNEPERPVFDCRPSTNGTPDNVAAASASEHANGGLGQDKGKNNNRGPKGEKRPRNGEEWLLVKPGASPVVVQQPGPGEVLGYYSSATSTFRPLATEEVGGAAQAGSVAVESVANEEGAVKRVGQLTAQSDNELKQLTVAYHPALWIPDKALVQDTCWQIYAARNPDKERTTDIKAATQECSPDAVKVLRQEHFGRLEERQRLREVALFVTDRINRGLFKPVGTACKVVDTIKVKVMALELPERAADAPKPAVALQEYAKKNPLDYSTIAGSRKKLKLG